ncbi:hypothetical protein GCM10009716_47400 [Streptomyces sodiiphilus]|uniref:Uncharacterized protein n=1 Tax=Streptomyces sodiiphilus TaxID=226217 RepID=A0ABP5BAN4_9ACTN
MGITIIDHGAHSNLEEVPNSPTIRGFTPPRNNVPTWADSPDLSYKQKDINVGMIVKNTQRLYTGDVRVTLNGRSPFCEVRTTPQ